MDHPRERSVRRRDTSFMSDGARCAAWLYSAGASASTTCIVMAHGFGATRHYGLEPYAQRFALHGHDVLVFDYRHLGESEGEPRGLIKVARQHADWRAAIAHARSRGHRRIVLWGTSFSGGHVLQLAADDRDVCGVIAQVPHVSGMTTSRAAPLRVLPGLVVAIALDALFRLFGRRYFIPAFGREGRVAALSTPGAYDALLRMLPRRADGREDPTWRAYLDRHNRVASLALVEALTYSPGRRAAEISCPVLIQAGRRDRTTPFAAARAAAARVPDCEFRAHDFDHFDVYLEPAFETVVGEQLAFLRRRIGHGPRLICADTEASG